MKQFITLTLFLIVGLYNAETHAKTLNLSPNETKVMTNSSLWTINATCTIQNKSHQKSKVRITVMKHSGSINGRTLSKGQGTLVTVQDNSNVSVSAESGTQINLLNLSSDSIQANCST